MTIAIICVLIAGLQPLFWSVLAKLGSRSAGLQYDNKTPRVTMANYHGWCARSNWAQANAHETFPFFAAAVILAMVTGVDTAIINTWAITFVVLRFIYGACYIFDKDSLRSMVWVLAALATIRLYVAAMTTAM